MKRYREFFGTDVFAKSEKRVVSPEIINRGTLALIDFDLLHARVAFDVENAIAREQVVIEFLRAADIQDRISFAVKLPDFV